MDNFSTPSLVKILHHVFRDPPSKLDSQTMADLLGKPYATLMSELSRQPGHKLGADLVLPLCRVTESVEPIKFLARQLGGVFIKMPDSGQGAEGLVETLAASIKEFAEFCSETAASISDGVVTKGELDRITCEGHEAVEAIMAMVKLARTTYEVQAKIK